MCLCLGYFSVVNFVELNGEIKDHGVYVDAYYSEYLNVINWHHSSTYNILKLFTINANRI